MAAMTIIGLLLLLFIGTGQAAATSWVDIPPEEVVERANIAVLGRYNFESAAAGSAAIFVGYHFAVEKVYKGEASAVITAGIDGFDTGWANEFQTSGGTFLLFLEKTDDRPFPVPVGGPNGMIQVAADNKVQTSMGGEAAFFQAYLDNGSPRQPDAAPAATDGPAAKRGDSLWLVIVLAASGSTVLLFGYRIVQMRTKDSP